jgi:hypothetical protein
MGGGVLDHPQNELKDAGAMGQHVVIVEAQNTKAFALEKGISAEML